MDPGVLTRSGLGSICSLRPVPHLAQPCPGSSQPPPLKPPHWDHNVPHSRATWPPHGCPRLWSPGHTGWGLTAETGSECAGRVLRHFPVLTSQILTLSSNWRQQRRLGWHPRNIEDGAPEPWPAAPETQATSSGTQWRGQRTYRP